MLGEIAREMKSAGRNRNMTRNEKKSARGYEKNNENIRDFKNPISGNIKLAGDSWNLGHTHFAAKENRFSL